ncbi:MAG: DUF1987 domain-containing protein [Bacteroidales bacterium]|nr:DUF1987 domain-containing protein [Bacteroidales bacterium]MBR4689660.1 DUF1987 domain-containing protein [Bacteroidales bacterium]MBR7034261.1 DUF1987 domain-containing protein [Bacteroidales bacterium]
MEHLYIEATAHTPEVYFNIDDDKLCMLGRSFPEDAASFYIPVVTWLENNIQEFAKRFVLEIQLEYFNTASAKYLLKMIHIMEKYKSKHNIPVIVRWLYFENDTDMKDSGTVYQQFVTIPFEFIAVERK